MDELIPAAPVGFLTTVILVSVFAFTALRPPLPRRSSPFRVSFLIGHLINEQPLLGLAWLASGTWSTLATEPGTPAWWTAALLTAAPAACLLALAVRARSARGALDEALESGLGVRAPKSGPPLLRVLLPPLFWRPDVRRLANRRYGAARAQRLDVYLPRRRPKGAPVLLYLHGGGFRIGSKLLGALPLLHRMAGHGWVCASANYRLRSPYGDSLADAGRALAWLREHAEELGADPSRVIVAGGSAGAHLASVLALTDDSVSGAVGFYGYYGPAGSDAPDVPSSPRECLHAAAPPFLIVHGALDTLVPAREARRFAEELEAVSAKPVVYAELPGTQHNFDLFHSLRFHAVAEATEAFAGHVVGRPPGTAPLTRSGPSSGGSRSARPPAGAR